MIIITEFLLLQGVISALSLFLAIISLYLFLSACGVFSFVVVWFRSLSLARSLSLSLIRGSSSSGGGCDDDCVDDGFLRFFLAVAMVTDACVTMIAAGDRQGLLR